MEQPINGAKKEPSWIQRAKQLTIIGTIRAVFVAGVVSLGVVLFIATLAALPKTRSKTLSLVETVWAEVVSFVESIKFGTTPHPTPDSPIVVRGGSFTALQNTSKPWAQNLHNSNVWQVDIGGPPNTLYVDGIDEQANPTYSPEHEQIPTLTRNWGMTLTFNNTDPDNGNKPTQLQICTKLDANSNCDLRNTDAFDNTSTKIYLQSDPGDAKVNLAGEDINRTGARLRYVLPGCPPAPSPDLDPKCNHVVNVQIYGISGHSGPYPCVDGACDIMVNHN